MFQLLAAFVHDLSCTLRFYHSVIFAICRIGSNKKLILFAPWFSSKMSLKIKIVASLAGMKS